MPGPMLNHTMFRSDSISCSACLLPRFRASEELTICFTLSFSAVKDKDVSLDFYTRVGPTSSCDCVIIPVLTCGLADSRHGAFGLDGWRVATVATLPRLTRLTNAFPSGGSFHNYFLAFPEEGKGELSAEQKKATKTARQGVLELCHNHGTEVGPLNPTLKVTSLTPFAVRSRVQGLRQRQL